MLGVADKETLAKRLFLAYACYINSGPTNSDPLNQIKVSRSWDSLPTKVKEGWKAVADEAINMRVEENLCQQ